MKQQDVISRFKHSIVNFGALLSVSVLLSYSPVGRAALSLSDEGFSTPPQTTVPQTWTNGLQGIANTNFRSCVIGQAMGLADLLGSNAASGQCSALSGAAFSLETECPGGGATEPLECEDFMERDNTFNRAAFDAYFRTLQSQQASLCCQSAKMAAINRELECVQSQASSLYSQISSLGEVYNRDFTTAETWNTQVQARIADRQKQIQTIGEKLNGGSAGDPGLRQIAQEVGALVDQIPTAVKNAEQAQRNLTVQKRQFEEMQKRTLAASAKSCFTDASEGLQCVAGGSWQED